MSQSADIGPVIFCGILLLAFAGFGLFMYRKVQARMIELMVTGVICSVPAGLVMRFRDSNEFGADDLNPIAQYALLGMLCLPFFFGAVWGLGWAKDLDEKHQGPRLLLLILGCFFPCSIFLAPFIPMFLSGEMPALVRVLLFLCIPILIIGFKIQYDCTRIRRYREQAAKKFDFPKS